MRYLTDSQAQTLRDLNFDVLKTKADYYPTCSGPKDHILFRAEVDGLHCYTMHGKYGEHVFKLLAHATGTAIVHKLQDVATGWVEDTDLRYALLNDIHLKRRLAICSRGITVSDLRYYASAIGIHPVDVKRHLGKRVSIYKLKKSELIELHDRMGFSFGLGPRIRGFQTGNH